MGGPDQLNLKCKDLFKSALGGGGGSPDQHS